MIVVGSLNIDSFSDYPIPEYRLIQEKSHIEDNCYIYQGWNNSSPNIDDGSIMKYESTLWVYPIFRHLGGMLMGITRSDKEHDYG